MSEKRDYYEILGASKTDSKEELKSKYRKLAIKYHPDKNPDDKVAEEKFKEISEAYNTLSDDSKRKMYDQFGHQAPNGGRPGGFNPFGGGGFEDIFNTAFNFRGGFNQGPQKGRDLKVDVVIEFMDAVHGITKDVVVNKNTLCDLCNGSGCKEGTQKTTCSVCNGSGSVVQNHSGFKLQTTCSACHGEGKIISSPCEKCMGKGHVSTTKTLSVTIPAGVNNGNRMLLNGEGDNIDTSIPPGDLHLFIHVKPHTVFQRNGSDIMYEAEISFVQAILGDKISVPSLYSDDGNELVIPKGTQYGEILKLNGEGITIPNTDSKGSLLVKVIIKIPTNVTLEQEKLLKEFN